MEYPEKRNYYRKQPSRSQANLLPHWEISIFKILVKKYSDKVLMAPYQKLDAKIALTAWTRLDKFNDFDTERIEKFINIKS